MPTADADLDARQIRISTEYRDKDLIRQVPGARWNGDAKVWTVPLSWTSCKMLRAVFEERLEITETLAKWAWTEYEERILPTLEWRESAMSPAAWGGEKYGFQPPAVEFLASGTATILADEMGTGKTKQTIDALQKLGDDAYPVLIVCPASVKRGWKREFEAWAPERTVEIVTGNVTRRRKTLSSDADVFVMNYEQLRSHSRLAPYGSVNLTDAEKTPKELNEIEFRSVVADEAHRIKDAKAKQTRALKAAAGDAEYRFALTGTPIANRPDELWSLLNFVAPNEWPSKTRFVDRYCAQAWNGFGHEVLGIEPSSKDEFYEILDPRFLRRPIDVVLPFLPQITQEIREVEMKPAQRKLYESMEEGFIAQTEDGAIMAPTPLAQTTRLLQFASASCEVVEVGDSQEVRMSLPSNKVEGLLDELDALGSEQVVVFAQHRQLVDLADAALREKGISFGRITGAENETQRDDALQAFKRGDLRVMLLTLGAGGTGIDGLQVARVAIFMEESWSLVEMKQALGRLRRAGQESDSILAITLISPGTIEEYRQARLEMKGDLLEEITRDREALRRFLEGKGATE